MPRSAGRLTGSLAAIVAASLFATLGPVSRGAYEAGMTPTGFTFWRALIGAFVVVAILAAGASRGRPRLALRTVPPRARLALAAAAITGVVLNLAIFTAFQRTAIALALFAFYTYPAVVAAASILLGEETLSRRRGIALVLALAGMAVVVLGGSGAPGRGPGFDALGFGLALVGSAAQAVYVLLGRRGFPTVPSGEATLVVLAGSAAGYACLALVTGGAAIALPLEAPAVLAPVAWAGIAGAGIPSLLFMVAIRAIGPTRTSILALLEPVVGVVLAAVVLGESLAPLQAAGGVLVLAAAGLLQRGEAAEPHESVAIGPGPQETTAD